jgi:hypothetical protein
MTVSALISKALEFVGYPEEYFYSISYYRNSMSVNLQGEYKSGIVSSMTARGLNPTIETSGFLVFDIKSDNANPNIRLVLT